MGSHLCSKDDFLQEEAINAFKIVFVKCSTVPSIQSIVNHLCKIYNGSEGKLSLQSQKFSVLKAIGLASCNSVSVPEEKQTIFEMAINELMTIAKQETTESSVIMTFNQIKMWIVNSNCELPESFWKFTKEFRKGKLATSQTSTALYDCINCYVVNLGKLNFLVEDDILNALLNSSRNMTSSIAKINVLDESLHSSVILLNIYKRDQSLGKTLIFH